MIKRIIIITTVLLLFSLPCYCYEPNIGEYIPEEMEDKLPGGIIDSVENENTLDYKYIFESIGKFFKSSVKGVLKNFFTILSLAIVSACFNMLCNTLESESIKKTFSYISSVCFAVILYSILDSLWSEMSLLFEDINSLMNAITPSITLIYALGGNVTSAAVNEAGTSILLTVFQDICYYGLRPILQICFGFSIVSCMSGSLNLAPIARFVRTAYTTLLVFVISIMGCVMSLQSMLGQASDSLGMRTVKFASSAAIPIVGGALSEAASSVAKGIGMIKSGFGILAIIAIGLMVLPIIIDLWMNKMAFSLGSAICGVFGIERESTLISSAGELINFALAISTAVSILFILNIALFTRAAVAIGG
ncbi:MAG: hypothetical protein E7591_06930 [Ruminococcaceae bacterium]|nr:hypothetical protein [Oscillospiraceae bacterium]